MALFLYHHDCFNHISFLLIISKCLSPFHVTSICNCLVLHAFSSPFINNKPQNKQWITRFIPLAHASGIRDGNLLQIIATKKQTKIFLRQNHASAIGCMKRWTCLASSSHCTWMKLKHVGYERCHLMLLMLFGASLSKQGSGVKHDVLLHQITN